MKSSALHLSRDDGAVRILNKGMVFIALLSRLYKRKTLCVKNNMEQ